MQELPRLINIQMDLNHRLAGRQRHGHLPDWQPGSNNHLDQQRELRLSRLPGIAPCTRRASHLLPCERLWRKDSAVLAERRFLASHLGLLRVHRADLGECACSHPLPSLGRVQE